MLTEASSVLITDGIKERPRYIADWYGHALGRNVESVTTFTSIMLNDIAINYYIILNDMAAYWDIMLNDIVDL